MVMVVSASQPLKAVLPIEVTLLGMVKSLRETQPLNTPLPIVIMLLDKSTFFRLIQPEKVLKANDVTLEGTVISLKAVQP